MDRKEIYSYQDILTEWRNDFHAHPELGFQEFRTSKRIAEILEELGAEVVQGFCKNAVMGIIRGEKPGPVVGIRADIDALAMDDVKNAPYKSQNAGVCHACGHDAHTTIALGVAKYFMNHKEELCGTVKLIFQPNEEGTVIPTGAPLVVESGVTDDVDMMLCVHLHPDYKTGTVLLRDREMLASSDDFKLSISCEGGHGGYPHSGTDALIAANQIFNAYQTIVSREVNVLTPAVLSICYLQAGSPDALNVMPCVAAMGGTLRTLDNSARDYIVERMEKIANAICEMNHCTLQFDDQYTCVVLNNDKEVNDLIAEAAKEIVGAENVMYMEIPEMGSDDFAFYKKDRKAAYYYLGSTRKEHLGEYTFHQPNFDLDPDVLPIGTAIMVGAIEKFCK